MSKLTNMIKKIALFAILLFIQLGCHFNKGKEYPFSIPKMQKRSLNYLEKYGKLEYQLDTIILHKGLEIHYSNGILKRIGKVDKYTRLPTGYWFEFGDHNEGVTYILRFHNQKIDSINCRIPTINQRW